MTASAPLHPLVRRSILFTVLGWLQLLPVIGGALGARDALRAISAIRASNGAWSGEPAAFRSLLGGILATIVSASVLCLAIIVFQPFNQRNERRNEDAVRKSEIQLAYEAVRAYADRNDGRIPTDLDTLVDDGLLLPRSVASYRDGNGTIAIRIAVQGTWAGVADPEHTVCVEAREPNTSGRLPRVFMDGRFEYVPPK